jgi:hypothetical protein
MNARQVETWTSVKIVVPAAQAFFLNHLPVRGTRDTAALIVTVTITGADIPGISDGLG